MSTLTELQKAEAQVYLYRRQLEAPVKPLHSTAEFVLREKLKRAERRLSTLQKAEGGPA